MLKRQRRTSLEGASARLGILVLLIAACALALAACGGSDSTSSSATTESEPAPEKETETSEEGSEGEAETAAASELPKNTCQAFVGCNVFAKVPWEALEGANIDDMGFVAVEGVFTYTEPLNECLEEHGATVKEQLPEADLGKLQSNMQSAFSSKASAVTLMGSPMDGLGGLLKEGAEAGTQVIGWAVGKTQPNLMGVDVDQHLDGTKAIETLVEKVGPKAKIGIVTSTVNTALINRNEAFEQYAKENNIDIVMKQENELTSAAAQQDALAMLEANPEIEGWIGGYSDFALGIVAAMKAKGSDSPVVGLDGSEGEMESIRNGEQYASVADPKQAGGTLSCEALAVALNGEETFEKAIMESTVVTKENVPAKGLIDATEPISVKFE